ncbi:ComEC/Rec2 family competence protein [Coraliomargarita akajimensis]|nr:ComEC/Rec2 family competence protein [Coraliomargarita akajimensis]
MLLGQKSALSSEQITRFQQSGTMHLFAISGLHIGVIATVIAQTLGLIRIPRRLRPVLGLSILYLYVDITGGSPSAIRAFLMTSFFWLSYGFSRQRNPFSALINSALFVLIIDPTQLWSLGFQLSYSVVLSILLFGIPFYNSLQQATEPFRWLPSEDWNWRHQLSKRVHTTLCISFSISLAAWLASAPLCAGHFGYISPASILLNVALIGLASLVICSGVLSLATSLCGIEGLASFINHAAWLGIAIMDYTVSAFTALPTLVFHCPNFPLSYSYAALIGLFASLACYRRMQHPARYALPSIVVAFCLYLGWLSGQA